MNLSDTSTIIVPNELMPLPSPNAKSENNADLSLSVSTSFGRSVEHYTKGRKGYPELLFNFLKTQLNSQEGQVLDIGCGTGIATRQLRQKFSHVAGSDIDSAMIKRAKAEQSDSISYKAAPAQKLPFRCKKFQLVTAFLSFHWITKTRAEENAAMKEIKRILRPGGFFAIVTKTNAPSYHNKGSDIVKKYSAKKVEEPKEDIAHFRKILKRHKFTQISLQEFSGTETRTLDEALAHFQSISKWQGIEKTEQPQALEELRNYLKQILDEQKRSGGSGEHLTRAVTTNVIYGRLPENHCMSTRSRQAGYSLRSRFVVHS